MRSFYAVAGTARTPSEIRWSAGQLGSKIADVQTWEVYAPGRGSCDSEGSDPDILDNLACAAHCIGECRPG
jgi:hypothetical protein